MDTDAPLKIHKNIDSGLMILTISWLKTYSDTNTADMAYRYQYSIFVSVFCINKSINIRSTLLATEHHFLPNIRENY